MAANRFDKYLNTGVNSGATASRFDRYINPQAPEGVDQSLFTSLQGRGISNAAISTLSPGKTSFGSTLLETSANLSDKFLQGAGTVLSAPFYAIGAVEKGIGAGTQFLAQKITGKGNKTFSDLYKEAPTAGGAIAQSLEDIIKPKTTAGFFLPELFGQLADAGVAAAVLGPVGERIATKTGVIKVTPEQMGDIMTGRKPVGKPLPQETVDLVKKELLKPETQKSIIKQATKEGVIIKTSQPASVPRQIASDILLGGKAKNENEVLVGGKKIASRFDKYVEGAPKEVVAPAKTEQTTLTPEVQSLALEARKYSSAEEFTTYYLNNQDKIPTSPEYQKFLQEKDTFTKRENQIYSEMKAMRDKYSQNTINQVPPADITKYENLQKELGQTLSQKTLAKVPEGVVKTHIGDKALASQLTDIWNQAQQTPLNPNIPETAQKPSKVAKSVEVKAIEKGLTQGFGDIAGYDPITIKDQAQRAADLMARDIEQAKKMVKGEIPMESGLKGEMLIKAMEDFAQKKGDVQLLMDIASSPLVAETSAHAQAMRILAEREPDSAVAKMQEIRRNRAKALEKKTKGTVAEKTKETVNEIKKEIKKTSPTKEDWNSFVDSIICT